MGLMMKKRVASVRYPHFNFKIKYYYFLFVCYYHFFGSRENSNVARHILHSILKVCVQAEKTPYIDSIMGRSLSQSKCSYIVHPFVALSKLL